MALGGKQIKILHLHTSVGGHSRGISLAERKLGLVSDCLYSDNNWLNYDADYLFSVSQKKGLSKAFEYSKIISLSKRYDILHFNFGMSLLDFPSVNLYCADLALYGKRKIFVTFNGCDARQKYKNISQREFSPCSYEDCYNGICNSGLNDILKENRIKAFERKGASFFAVNPDLCRFLPDDTIFLPYAISNWDNIETIPFKPVGKEIIIVHAPTNKGIKGSDIITEAVNELKKKYRINFLLIENIPNKEALKLYAKADIIIDQLRIGWYGGFAVEALKMGKPVLVYINKDDLKFIPSDMAKDCLSAFICADEHSITDVLEGVILNHQILKEKREAGLDYVYKWHEPMNVAKITKAAYLK